MVQNIRLLTLADLQEVVIKWGFKKLHGTAIYNFIWHSFLNDFIAMKSLDEKLVVLLEANYFIPKTKIHSVQISTDGTIKCSIILYDNNLIEGVLIPTPNRVTICVSCQVGCSLSCKFCATGYMDRKRNVGFDEIVDQVVLLNHIALEHYKKPISNVVFMGMGEPMLNYQNVLNSIVKLTDQKGLSIAPKRITVSTAGIAKMIKKLGDEHIKINLALSLHAANDSKRNDIMAINESNNLEELANALNYFYSNSKNEITLEYVLLKGFNDSMADAEDLIRFVQKVPIHLVNILEYNAIQDAEFQKSSEEVMQAFIQKLHANNINAHLRRSRGKDIAAACGQLVNTMVL